MGNDSPEKHEFKVQVNWTEGTDGYIVLEGKPSLYVSSPTIWEGRQDYYSPHDLFVTAVTSCYITTFATMMKKVKQPLNAHQVSGRAVLHKHPEGGWQFTDIYILMDITVPKEANLKQVERAVTLAEKYCHVTRSIKSKVHVTSKITQTE